MKIRLTNSASTAIIDSEDAKRVLTHLWYVNAGGYAVSHGPKKDTLTYLHRFVMHARRGGPSVDHKNGIRLDNRKSNLRFANQRVQQINSRRVRKDRGVYAGRDRATGKWYSSIGNRGVKIHLGLFSSKRKALAARRDAEIKYFGVECP